MLFLTPRTSTHHSNSATILPVASFCTTDQTLPCNSYESCFVFETSRE